VWRPVEIKSLQKNLLCAMELVSGFLETIEVIGFLVFSLIVAGLVLTFFFKIDFRSIQENIFQMFLPKPELEKFQKLNISQLLGRMNNCWQQCGFGETALDCGTVQLTTEDLNSENLANGLTEQDFQYRFQKLNFCSDCGIEIANPPIKAPAIVHISCNDATKKLKLG